VKQIFHNPYACIKVIFFDRKQTNKLARAAIGDPEWSKLRRFIQHVPGHRDHFHVRIGDGPGEPGCPAAAATDSDGEMED
jgi:murein endopeptidase